MGPEHLSALHHFFYWVLHHFILLGAHLTVLLSFILRTETIYSSIPFYFIEWNHIITIFHFIWRNETIDPWFESWKIHVVHWICIRRDDTSWVQLIDKYQIRLRKLTLCVTDELLIQSQFIWLANSLRNNLVWFFGGTCIIPNWKP